MPPTHIEPSKPGRPCRHDADTRTDHASASSAYLVPALLIGVVAYALFTYVPFFQKIELNALDLRFRLRPPIRTSSRLATIDIDAATIQRSGAWPLSRTFYAELLKALHRYEATLMAFDMFFPDPAPLTLPPDRMQEALGLLEAEDGAGRAADLLRQMALSGDDALADALQETGLGILAQTFSCMTPSLFTDNTELARRTRIKKQAMIPAHVRSLALAAAYSMPMGSGPPPAVPARAFGVEPPLPHLLEQAAGLGFAQVLQDIDGVVRRCPLFILYDGRLYPSLSLMSISLATGVALEDMQIEPGRHVRLPGARLHDEAGRPRHADVTVPVDRCLRMIVNWTGDYHDTLTHLPASVVLRFLGIDAVRTELARYRDDLGQIVDQGFALLTGPAVRRGLLTPAEAEITAGALFLAELAETAVAAGDDRADFLAGFDQDYAAEAGAIWDQVSNNQDILARLIAEPDTPYARLKAERHIPDARDDGQRHAVDFLRFLVKRGKDPDLWRPLYFFPPIEITIEGGATSTRLSPLDLADKLFFVGLTAPGTHDYHPMPFNPVYPMVGLHANAANTILTEQFIRALPRPAALALTLLCALLTALLARRLHPVGGAISLALLACAYVWAGTPAFNSRGLWLPVVAPVVAGAGAYLAIVIHRALHERREKQRIHTAFSTYMSPAVVSQVLRDPAMLQLGGQRRVMTVFFSDLQGFTAISERCSPEDLVTLLNEYLDAMTRVVFSNEGTLDKYEGDGIMAFWSAPIEQDHHARLACYAALDCAKHLETVLHPKWQAENKPLLVMRIGLNTGPMIVGNMGSNVRMDYTVTGDAVNLGARLEAANKLYGTHIMMSEFTCNLVRDDIVHRQLDRLRVVGKKQAVRIYEVIARREDVDPRTTELLEVYNRGLAHYADREWQQALDDFGAALELCPNDGPSHTYLERCRAYSVNPPPADWDGVWAPTSK